MYGALRCLMRTLGLTPFRVEDFCTSLCMVKRAKTMSVSFFWNASWAIFRLTIFYFFLMQQEATPLIDQIFVALLQALREDDELWMRPSSVCPYFLFPSIWMSWTDIKLFFLVASFGLSISTKVEQDLHWSLLDEMTWPALLSDRLTMVRTGIYIFVYMHASSIGF